MQKHPCFGGGVLTTRTFLRDWGKLTSQKRELVQQKILLLATNYRHPSLRTHPLHRSRKDFWSCSLSKTERLVYSCDGPLLILHAVGSHAVVDSAHLRSFFRSWRESVGAVHRE